MVASHGFLRPRRWLLLLLLALLLLSLLLLFFLGQMMPDHATGRGTRDGMVTRDVPGYTADDSSFDTTLRLRSLPTGQEHDSEHWCHDGLQFQCCGSRHTISSFGNRHLGVTSVLGPDERSVKTRYHDNSPPARRSEHRAR
jgi:hypothetical protein